MYGSKVVMQRAVNSSISLVRSQLVQPFLKSILDSWQSGNAPVLKIGGPQGTWVQSLHYPPFFTLPTKQGLLVSSLNLSPAWDLFSKGIRQMYGRIAKTVMQSPAKRSSGSANLPTASTFREKLTSNIVDTILGVGQIVKATSFQLVDSGSITHTPIQSI